MGKLGAYKNACAIFVLSIAATTVSAQTLVNLVDFDGNDGQYSNSSLVQGTDGNLYGTTIYGGTNDYGAVFKVSTAGALTTLHSFGLTDHGPFGSLVLGTDGNFYGTTLGTVFKITPTGAFTTLHTFTGYPTDGLTPYAGLIQGSDGNFYGTTSQGGAFGSGTVFKITPAGAVTLLHSFDYDDGSYPVSELVQASNGDFYGTTEDGGTDGDCYCGTVFQLTPAGALTTLHSFAGYPTEGSNPYAGLTQGNDGSLYGTTYGGGANNYGTVFKITTAGTLTTLHSFAGGASDGSNPNAAIVQGTDGNFYGTTIYGGTEFDGIIFKVTTRGTLTTVYDMGSNIHAIYPSGAYPFAGLLQDTNGDFYGTTQMGPGQDDGSVFSLSVGFGPFVETNPSSGKVKSRVTILGTNLTGATSVSFNGTATTFVVVSSSEITTSVPAGATTGTVQVKTPSGTLTSNVVFRVP